MRPLNQLLTPMIELTNKLISGIAEGDDEALLGAGEVGRFLVFGLETSSIIEPYSSTLSETPATEEDGKALQEALIAYLEKNAPNINPSAINALGKFQSSSNIEFLRSQVAIYLESSLEKFGALYSSMDALDRSGEKDVLGSSSSIFEIDDTIQKAREYMSKYGKVFPH